LYCKEDPKVENINLKSIEDHIRLKDPQRHKAKLLELLFNREENKEEELTQQQESENDLFECYYCVEFLPPINKNEYEEHMDSNHPGWPAYPSMAYLKRFGLYSQGKKWEI